MATSHPQRDIEMLSTQVIRELPDDIEPLYQSVDPDALNELFADRDSNGMVAFEHAGHQITARSTGDVDVRKE